jgi:hypothetical protein
MPLYKHGRRHEAAVELRFRLITATSEEICSVSLRCEALAASGREHPLRPAAAPDRHRPPGLQRAELAHNGWRGSRQIAVGSGDQNRASVARIGLSR